MNTMKKVRAGDGKKVFFPQSIKAAPGRRTFILEGDTVIEVDTALRFNMRSISNGDLVVVKTTKPRKSTKPETTDTE